MNKTVILIATSLLILFSFKGFATDSDEKYLNEIKYRYISIEQVEKSKGKTTTEIFTFIEYNSDGDYDFTVLKNPNNETISMNGGPGAEHTFSKGEKVKVTWELTTLYEAGEGDAPYYYWSIVEIKKIKITQEKEVQACVLYGTNKNNGYPIPKQKCVEIRLDISCDEKIVNSDNNSKIWRSYPMSDCSDPKIKAGLSERYLLEGVD